MILNIRKSALPKWDAKCQNRTTGTTRHMAGKCHSLAALPWSRERAVRICQDSQGSLPKLRLGTMFMIIQRNFDCGAGFFPSLLSDRFR
jgi:hypothetical protein